MNQDQLVKFETACLAKEKGFSFTFVDDENYRYGLHSYMQKRNDVTKIYPLSHWTLDIDANSQQYKDLQIDAPTQTLLRKWLREVHNIYIELIIDGWGDDALVDGCVCYRAFIWEVGKPKPGPADDLGSHKFEVILEVALYQALNLVNVKPKLYIGQYVFHQDIYDGKEEMKVVGIREHEVELEGDYSGGTHCVTQKSWLPIKGIILKNPLIRN